MSKKILAVVVEPGKDAEIKEIDSDLKSLQSIVGGYIEAIYPFRDDVALVCNDEGKINGLPYNRFLLDDNGRAYDIIAGTFIIVGLTHDSFGSLDQDMAQKYANLFNNLMVGQTIKILENETDKNEEDEHGN